MKCDNCNKNLNLNDLKSYYFIDTNNNIITICNSCFGLKLKNDKKISIVNNINIKNKKEKKLKSKKIKRIDININKRKFNKGIHTTLVGYLSLVIASLFLGLFIFYKNIFYVILSILLTLFAIILQISIIKIKDI